MKIESKKKIWYDRKTRSWVCQELDEHQNQIGDAYFCHSKEEAQKFLRGEI